jgi:hypothetical protein
MQTVAQRPTKIQHYASYVIHGQEVYGIATLLSGGYSFVPDVGEGRLVSYKDVDLTLYGHVATAEQQWDADQAQGGLVRTTSRTLAA